MVSVGPGLDAPDRRAAGPQVVFVRGRADLQPGLALLAGQIEHKDLVLSIWQDRGQISRLGTRLFAYWLIR